MMVYKTKRHINTLVLLAILFSFNSCSDFLASIGSDKEWIVNESGNIILHTRPEEFSDSNSPDEDAISIILENQNYYYQKIKDSLHINYNNKVLIYLYNHDEALDKIGTNSGGHAISSRLTIYYTYLPGTYIDVYDRPTYIGAKELVHLITHRALGTNFTRMMNAGYSAAFEGSFGKAYDEENEITVARTLNDWMQAHYINNNILSPGQLLFETDITEEIFAPNAGFFIRYLWERFGIIKINNLFNEPSENFKDKFMEVCNINFSTLSTEYMDYIETNFSEVNK
ncbi:MAG: hypothetical protein R6U11_06390 [Bacteroidales bacterium]